MGYLKISIFFLNFAYQFNLRTEIRDENHFVMLNVLTGKNKFYEDANR